MAFQGHQVLLIHHGAGIDIAAVAIWTNLSVAEVATLDLGYSPPFSPVWDPVQMAAKRCAALV